MQLFLNLFVHFFIEIVFLSYLINNIEFVFIVVICCLRILSSQYNNELKYETVYRNTRLKSLGIIVAIGFL